MPALAPFPALPNDISLVLTGTAGQRFLSPNANRSFLQYQAPSGGLWYSYTNSTCTTSGTGCFFLGAGQTYLSGYVVPASAVYVFGTANQLLVGSEC